MTITQLIQVYEEISRPSVLFNNADEVRLFLTDATEDELLAFEMACVTDEAYEYAQIARDLLTK